MLEAWKSLKVFADMDTVNYFSSTIMFASGIKNKKDSWAGGYFSDGSFPLRSREEKKIFGNKLSKQFIGNFPHRS